MKLCSSDNHHTAAPKNQNNIKRRAIFVSYRETIYWVGQKKRQEKLNFRSLESVNPELLKLSHLIFLTVCNIIAEFDSSILSISEHVAIFFNLFRFTFFKN